MGVGILPLWQLSVIRRQCDLKPGHIITCISRRMQSFEESIGVEFLTDIAKLKQSLTAATHETLAISAIKSFVKSPKYYKQIRALINRLKDDYNVLPYATKNRIIMELNEVIVMFNKSAPTMVKKHGIILQIKQCNSNRPTNNRARPRVIYAVRCNECHRKMHLEGGIDVDIYSPAQCQYCRSFDLNRCTMDIDEWRQSRISTYAERVKQRVKSIDMH